MLSIHHGGTLRGLRYRHGLSVPGLPDMDKVTEDILSLIEQRFLPAPPDDTAD